MQKFNFLGAKLLFANVQCVYFVCTKNQEPTTKALLSYDVASESKIARKNNAMQKIDKPLVVYRFSGNVMTSITTLRTNDKIITFSQQKRDFKVIFTS